MAWKPIERRMTPEENLRPVGHVLMAEGPWRHGLEHGRAGFAATLVLDLHRDAVTVPLQRIRTTLVSQHGEVDHTNRLAEAPFEITLDVSWFERHRSPQ